MMKTSKKSCPPDRLPRRRKSIRLPTRLYAGHRPRNRGAHQPDRRFLMGRPPAGWEDGRRELSGSEVRAITGRADRVSPFKSSDSYAPPSSEYSCRAVPRAMVATARRGQGLLQVSRGTVICFNSRESVRPAGSSGLADRGSRATRAFATVLEQIQSGPEMSGGVGAARPDHIRRVLCPPASRARP